MSHFQVMPASNSNPATPNGSDSAPQSSQIPAPPSRKRSLEDSNLMLLTDEPESFCRIEVDASHKKQRTGEIVPAESNVEGDNADSCGSAELPDHIPKGQLPMLEKTEYATELFTDDMTVVSEPESEAADSAFPVAAIEFCQSGLSTVEKDGNASISENTQSAATVTPVTSNSWGRNKQFRTVFKETTQNIRQMKEQLDPEYKGPRLTSAEMVAKLQQSLEGCDSMNSKYETRKCPAKVYKPFIPRFPAAGVETRRMIAGPPGAPGAERERPWIPTGPIPQKILWRLTDHASQAVVRNINKGMTAGGAPSLVTRENRGHQLTCHVDFGNRKKTPFISCCTDLKFLYADRIQKYRKRAAIKGIANTVWHCQFNSNARIANGGSILNAYDELKHYSRGSVHERLRMETLLTYQVYPIEIVWLWIDEDIQRWLKAHNYWDAIRVNGETIGDITKWYDAIGYPAYTVHETARLAGKSAEACRREVNNWLRTTDMSYAALIIGDDGN